MISSHKVQDFLPLAAGVFALRPDSTRLFMFRPNSTGLKGPKMMSRHKAQYLVTILYYLSRVGIGGRDSRKYLKRLMFVMRDYAGKTNHQFVR